MTTKRIKRTAAEILGELQRDPKFLAENAERERSFEAQKNEIDRAQQPLLEALKGAGIRVSSVWDLVNSPNTYPELVSLLVEHLNRPYPTKIREGIGRALAIPEPIEIWKELQNAYLAEEDQSTTGVKWVIHLALAAAADRSVLEDVIRLAVDKRHGGIAQCSSRHWLACMIHARRQRSKS